MRLRMLVDDLCGTPQIGERLSLGWSRHAPCAREQIPFLLFIEVKPWQMGQPRTSKSLIICSKLCWCVQCLGLRIARVAVRKVVTTRD
jgi:hypothetical protein